MIILPGDPLFDWTLCTCFPPGWRQVAASIGDNCVFVSEPGSGVLRAVTPEEKREYLYGGEYDERLAEIDDDEDFEDW